MWCKSVLYFVIAYCGKMPKDNRCRYMAHTLYVCCSDCGAAVVKIVGFNLGVLKYVVCL